MWTDIDYTTVDELKIGKEGKPPGTWLRLEETPKGNRIIRSWSNLSKAWIIMHRYNVEEQWSKWKVTCQRIHSRTQKLKKNGT